MPDFILVFVYVDLNPRERGFNQTNRRVGTRRLRTANLCRCVHASGRIPSPATRIKMPQVGYFYFGILIVFVGNIYDDFAATAGFYPFQCGNATGNMFFILLVFLHVLMREC